MNSATLTLDCVKDPESSMWIYVFLGNALRGIGETPVTPLGISYIDDFAKAENSAFYICKSNLDTFFNPLDSRTSRSETLVNHSI